MREFVEVADGKLDAKLMTDQIFGKEHQPKIRGQLEAKDNPPTHRKSAKSTDRSIDMAHEYIKRLEAQVKVMNDEHKFLQSRLEKAQKNKEDLSMGSWRSNEHSPDDSNIPHTNDRVSQPFSQ